MSPVRLFVAYPLSSLPLAGYAALVSLVSRAYQQTGHAPHLGLEPHQVGMIFPGDGLGGFVWLFVVFTQVFAWLAAFLVGAHCVEILARNRFSPKPRDTFHLCAQAVLCIAGVALFAREFNRWGYWLFD